ncbi:NtaA/DmoA family FMN-dependent monooxygenase [Pseudonocardia alaniniphila]|uniref:NtaA/DmoA family FMN-dependent monooxygenase n=1 Tax=Pseudonocardia alaniniphila TaxID=75291 RepID=A0ABS9TQP2_9PSEU|nr:NtaA/DmoA family FMN-dependent monooxygenase [Pseudonocardia alaniniphila]MCH6170862.1 NtaA/DmoA family FMN-dependent monooxygenase [Pseudonocardia alaniniphila]
MTRKKAHLLGFVQHGVMNHASTMWAHPQDKIGYSFARPEYWRDLGRIMERGLFDAMFIADELAPYTTYQGSSDAVVRYAAQFPVHDPAAVVPIVGAFTKHLGIGITLSTSFIRPYQMVRQLSTLDHLTGGRVGWNIVTSYSKSEFQAMGLENLTPRDKRYEVVEEYMQLCYQLWDSWDDDAISYDRSTGVFADPSKVREVDFQGRYFRSRGRSFVMPSPQRRPVLWQAGSSEQGRDFAARHAESVFGVFPTVTTMRAYADDIRARADRAGRDPSQLKLIFGLQTVVDRSRDRAVEKYEEFRSLIRIESALAIMSGHTGVDFSTLDLDDDVADVDAQGIRGLFDAILQKNDGKPVTVREAAELYGMAMGAPTAVGTPADVADEMEHYLDEGGCDGFMLLATNVPGCFVDIAELVVPELQRRGRYRQRYPGTTLRESLQEY